MIETLESKVVNPKTGYAWYHLVADTSDIFPTGEFPEGSGHYVADGSRLFERGTEISYEFRFGEWQPVGQKEVTLKNKIITANGTYFPADDNADGYSKLTVLVDAELEQIQIEPVAGTDIAVPAPVKRPGTAQTGYGDITVKAVTAAIDSNIKPENIKKDVQILGVTGNFDPAPTLTGFGNYVFTDSAVCVYVGYKTSTPTVIEAVAWDKTSDPPSNLVVLGKIEYEYKP